MRALQLRLAGVPVRIEPTFVVILALLGYGGGRSIAQIASWVAVAGASVLVHELGHAAAFRAFGSRPRIVLHGLGGLTVGETQPPARSVVVSLAGPVTGFAAGAAALLLSRRVTTDSVLLRTIFADLVFVNIAWGVFNLLPILPLDGGQAVTSALDVVTRGRAQRPARIISVATSTGLGLAALAAGQPWIAFLAAFFAFQNIQALGALGDRPKAGQLDRARQALLRDDPGTAARLAGEALGRASRRSDARALELLAWSNLAAGNLRDARAARARLGSAAGPGRGHELLDGLLAVAAGEPAAGVGAAFVRCEDPVALAVAARLLLQADRLDEALTDVPGDAAAAALETAQLVLHQAGLFQAAAEVGERLFARRPAPGVAYNVARGYSAAGDGDAALAWLDRAVAHGFRDLGQLDTHPDLAAVRATDRFRRLRASLR